MRSSNRDQSAVLKTAVGLSQLDYKMTVCPPKVAWLMITTVALSLCLTWFGQAADSQRLALNCHPCATKERNKPSPEGAAPEAKLKMAITQLGTKSSAPRIILSNLAGWKNEEIHSYFKSFASIPGVCKHKSTWVLEISVVILLKAVKYFNFALSICINYFSI